MNLAQTTFINIQIYKNIQSVMQYSTHGASLMGKVFMYTSIIRRFLEFTFFMVEDRNNNEYGYSM